MYNTHVLVLTKIFGRYETGIQKSINIFIKLGYDLAIEDWNYHFQTKAHLLRQIAYLLKKSALEIREKTINGIMRSYINSGVYLHAK